MATEAVTQNTNIFDAILSNKWFNPDYLFNQGVTSFKDFVKFSAANGPQIVTVFHTILFFFALFFLTLISYCVVRMFEIRAKEHKHLLHEIAEYAHHQAEHERKIKEGEGGGSKNERWVKTLSYLFSQHPSDWKLAVIEADSMLEALMNQLGFKGENLGEKLKSAANPARAGGEAFRHLKSAWEVHTIRNRIAHEGASFQLSQHEAKRIIAIYEMIFREFGFI
jgi:hypothetical protein